MAISRGSHRSNYGHRVGIDYAFKDVDSLAFINIYASGYQHGRTEEMAHTIAASIIAGRSVKYTLAAQSNNVKLQKRVNELLERLGNERS